MEIAIAQEDQLKDLNLKIIGVAPGRVLYIGARDNCPETMEFRLIIPIRYDAVRLPGKPLAVNLENKQNL